MLNFRLNHLRVPLNGTRDMEEETLFNRHDELGDLPEFTALKFQSESYWPWDQTLVDDDLGPDSHGQIGGVSVIPERSLDSSDQIYGD